MTVAAKLYNLRGIGLIVPWPTGIVYGQQGCNMHYQRELEGFFIPLNVHARTGNIATQLARYFSGPKWGGECCWGLDSETAEFVDSILASIPGYAEIKVDRARLAESMDQWIYVTVPDDVAMWLWPHTGRRQGDGAILTWE